MSEPDFPLVSAIIPAYNAEKFLAETIESVLAQTYPRVECVVVNDGSTDRTAEVAKSFSNSIRYFEKTNGGVSSARNFGIEKANGGLIAFLDADDLWLPEKIEKQIEVYRNNRDVGLIYSAVKIINEEKDVLSKIKISSEKDALSRILLLETPVYLTMTGVVPKKVFEEIGNFDENLSTSADADMACRIALKYRLLALDESLALYRQHNNQMHHNLSVLERDANILFKKIFSEGDARKGLAEIKGKAYSNLESTLAIGFYKQNDYKNCLIHLVKALQYSPAAVLRKLYMIFKEKIRLREKVNKKYV